MSIARGLAYAVRHPVAALRRIVAGPSPRNSQSERHPPEHEVAWRRYGQLAADQGFNDLVAILSFDCDTPEDIAAAEVVQGWLAERDMSGTFAVPGVMLEQGAETYRSIFARGGDFINHGWRPHTEWRGGRYWSITFYNEMDSKAVAEDIRRGHSAVESVIGKRPVGFRAPHFGRIETNAQWALIYATLRELNYIYSSSAMPRMALTHGPLARVDGIWEVPCTGQLEAPNLIFDSWTHVESPEKPVICGAYFAKFSALIDALQALGVGGILNLYVDPAHVVANDVYRRCLDYLIARGVRAIDFSEAIRRVAGPRNGAT